jgi:DMSO/TMAO reductase YedYZ molybdopterin-dependent catalytic subunit
MSEEPLTEDRRAPVRLIVPGRYGCTCIKWLNAITFINDDEEATSQMREFAARAHQQGVPKVAKDLQVSNHRSSRYAHRS